MERTKEDYEEWKKVVLEIYSDKSHMADAVWNQIWNDAQRDGYTDFLEDDEKDMSDLIETIIDNIR